MDRAGNVWPWLIAGDGGRGAVFSVANASGGPIDVVTSADTMRRSVTGGPKPVGNPIFIRASSGELLLEEPMETRPTRCTNPFELTPLCQAG